MDVLKGIMRIVASMRTVKPVDSDVNHALLLSIIVPNVSQEQEDQQHSPTVAA